jgi:hypothetical protein
MQILSQLFLLPIFKNLGDETMRRPPRAQLRNLHKQEMSVPQLYRSIAQKLNRKANFFYLFLYPSTCSEEVIWDCRCMYSTVQKFVRFSRSRRFADEQIVLEEQVAWRCCLSVRAKSKVSTEVLRFFFT